MRPLPFLLAMLAACGSPGPATDSCTTVFYADADGDGHGDPATETRGCMAPAGFTDSHDDCEDGNAAIHPGADETCDDADDDCDGQVDEQAVDATTWFTDADDDGYGAAADATPSCVQPGGTTAVHGDCDDQDDAVHPGAGESCDEIDDDCDGLVDELDPDIVGAGTWYTDADNDGYGDPATAVLACRQPIGSVENGSDCDDGFVLAHPGGTEVCDGHDDDCDGLDDDEEESLPDASVFYADSDGDGFGDASAVVARCTEPKGYVDNPDDCDDTDPTITEPMTYYDDGDGDGYGDVSSHLACAPDANDVLVSGDCHPHSAASYPGAREVCNGNDDDCDGFADDDDPDVVADTWYADADGDGYGDAASAVSKCVAPTGYVAAAADCDDADAAAHPDSTEWCDSIDNDCSGAIDDDVVYVDWYADGDGDGFGDPSDVTNDCVQPTGYLRDASDCNDGDAAVSPASQEVCANDSDDDCNGWVDDCQIPVTDADAIVETTAARSYLGEDGAVGDFDVDGTVDLVLATYGTTATMHVIPGPIGSAIDVDAVGVTVDGGGRELVGGDVNGDGLDDLASFGVSGANAFVFLGPFTADRSGEDAEITGDSSGTTFYSTAIVPDFDGDAIPDLVYGIPTAIHANGSVFLAAGTTSGTVSVSSSAYEIDGEAVGDCLGTAVASMDDMNGDGIADLALGAYSAGSGGTIYIVEGGLTAGVYDVGAIAAVTFTSPSGLLGAPGMLGLDYDVDGTTDLVASAGPGGSSGGVTGGGMVYAFLGPLSGAMTVDDAHATWLPVDIWDDLGEVASTGDFDGDKQPDIIMTAQFFDHNAGRTYVQIGIATGTVDVATLPSFVASETGANEGGWMTAIPDWDGDDRSEIAIGEPLSDVNVGAVYVFSGSSIF